MIRTNLYGAALCAFALVVLTGCAEQEKKETTADLTILSMRYCPGRPACAELGEGQHGNKDR